MPADYIQSLTLEGYEAIFNEAFEKLTTEGTVSIISVFVGILLFMIIYRRRVTIVNMWAVNNKMTLKKFLMLFCVLWLVSLSLPFLA